MKKTRIVRSCIALGALASLVVSWEASAFIIPNGGSVGGTYCQTANYGQNGVHGVYGNKGVVSADGILNSYFACPIFRTNRGSTAGLTGLVTKINNPNAAMQTCCVQSVDQNYNLLKSVCLHDTSQGPITLDFGTSINTTGVNGTLTMNCFLDNSAQLYNYSWAEPT